MNKHCSNINDRCNRCNSCFCSLFAELQSGTVVLIAIGPNFIVPEDEEEFKFICFDEHSCCITLADTDNDIVIFNCQDLVAVEIRTGNA